MQQQNFIGQGQPFGLNSIDEKARREQILLGTTEPDKGDMFAKYYLDDDFITQSAAGTIFEDGPDVYEQERMKRFSFGVKEREIQTSKTELGHEASYNSSNESMSKAESNWLQLQPNDYPLSTGVKSEINEVNPVHRCDFGKTILTYMQKQSSAGSMALTAENETSDGLSLVKQGSIDSMCMTTSGAPNYPDMALEGLELDMNIVNKAIAQRPVGPNTAVSTTNVPNNVVVLTNVREVKVTPIGSLPEVAVTVNPSASLPEEV